MNSPKKAVEFSKAVLNVSESVNNRADDVRKLLLYAINNSTFKMG